MADRDDFPPSSPLAFTLRGQKGALQKTAVLALHGFSSTPYEVAPLSHALSKEGAHVHAPLLAGHGVEAESKFDVSENDWTENARRGFDALPKDRRRVVVGASMGGLLALHLAAESSAVKALILLAPALSFAPMSRAMIEVSRSSLLKRKSWKKAEAGGDIASAFGREKNPAYDTLSHAGMGALARLRTHTQAILPQVRCPILLIHGNQDHTIDPQACTEIAMHSNAEHIEHHRLPNSFHVLGLDVDRHEINSLTQDFLERLP